MAFEGTALLRRGAVERGVRRVGLVCKGRRAKANRMDSVRRRAVEREQKNDSEIMREINEDRFDRQMRLFGKAGQDRIAASRVVIVGNGGLGTHVGQQLSLLGVKKLGFIDAQQVKRSSGNRYIGLRYDDPIPGTLKV